MLVRLFHSSHFTMTGRGRPQRARSPDSKPKERKPASPGRRSATKKEKQHEATKVPKKLDQQRHTEEEPSVPATRKGKTTNPYTEIHEQTEMPTEKTKDKTGSARGKLKENPSGDVMKTQLKMQPRMSKETTKASIKDTKVKAKLEVHLKDSTQKELKETLEKVNTPSTTAAKPKMPAATKAEVCEDKASQKRTKAPPDRSESSPKGRTEEEHTLKKILEKLKIRKKMISEASEVINDFIKCLIKYLRDRTECFKEAEELRTGSYYENLKISNPDEFDVMLSIPIGRGHIEPFGNTGAFYSVQLKRNQKTLEKFQKDNILSSCEMLKEFRNEVKTFAKDFPEWKMTAKKTGCPAVTLTTAVGTVTISLDVVLCLKVKSRWPSFTEGGFKIEQWLGAKAKKDHKWKPYYLVAKYEGRGDEENDGVLAKHAWRISFSHVEKDIIKNHGSEKTCCEKAGVNCCRKDCLKLLKYLLHILKENNSSFDKFCSYHAKTTLLHACCTRNKDSEWKASDLNHCFKRLLQDFEDHLRKGELFNFFIPSQNLLSVIGKKQCKNLADCIKKQCEKGFPVFKEDLCNTH